MAPEIAPYGSWHSPISPQMVVSSGIRLGQVYIDADTVYWTESRPMEKGRTVLVACKIDGKPYDLSPAEFNVRNAVHEMGGGAAIISEGFAYFSNIADHRLYKQKLDSKKAVAISKPGPFRYADYCHDKKRNRLIVVKEDHSYEGEEPINSLDVLPIDGEHEAEMLLAGSDFFSSPRISPDGRLLAWLTWNHPNMPWDETKLWTGNLGNDGSLSNMQLVAGGNGESIMQPEWGPDGTLYFISDKSGWWNLHASYSGLVEPLLEMNVEFGAPQWAFGASNYAVVSANKIICTYTKDGFWHLAEFDTDSRTLSEIETEYKDFWYLRHSGEYIAFQGGGPDRFQEIVAMHLPTRKTTTLKRSSTCQVDPSYLSHAQPIEFPTENGKTAYAFFYPAKNKDFEAPEGTLPPLIVHSHGGPTGATGSNLDLEMQFWTSRGFALVDVNYGGSTGYGREFRERLKGNWGIVDVDDCVNAAKYLIDSGKVDPNRVAISGGSAGGFTTLSALAFRKLFKAGASYYGVADLESLVRDTHKFESRYLDSLIGPFPAKKNIYDERSPVMHAEKIDCPVIFFQGLEDKIVPPSQSEAMVNALRKRGVPLAYLSFEGEQHGFRRSETQQKCISSELTFFCKIFGIERDDFEELEIENSSKLSAHAVSAKTS